MANDSKRYKTLRTKVEHMKLYPVQDALRIVKENATAKFDESVDVAVGSSRVDLQACKLEYSIVSPK